MYFFYFNFFFLHFKGFRILWCFSNLKILRYTIIISMVHLFFHQFFWVSNWKILDESKIYSYTLRGAEFNGKVDFSQNVFSSPYGNQGFLTHQYLFHDQAIAIRASTLVSVNLLCKRDLQNLHGYANPLALFRARQQKNCQVNPHGSLDLRSAAEAL